jgi:hypothetical protein
VTWLTISQDLSQEMSLLSGPVKALREKKGVHLNQLYEAEPQERHTIDEACLKYASIGKWPALNQTQAVLAYVRLGNAAEFAQFLARNGAGIFVNQPEDLPKATILEFLLIDYWHFAGNSRWRSA